MMIMGAMSMKVPSTRSARLIIRSTAMGSSDTAFIAAVMVAGTCRKAMSQPKAPAVPMTRSTIAVVRTAPSVASTKPARSI
jgi:hypothetical protein